MSFNSIVLPYQSGRFSAILTLPNSETKRIQDSITSNMQEFLTHLQLKNVLEDSASIMVPKFKREYTYENFETTLKLKVFDFSFCLFPILEKVIRSSRYDSENSNTSIDGL